MRTFTSISVGFSRPFQLRYRVHVDRVRGLFVTRTAASVGATGAVVGAFRGVGSAELAGIAAAISIYLIIAGIADLLDLRAVPLLPYFESVVGGTDTWSRGRHLLAKSAFLDDLAKREGLPALSTFAPGDDLVRGEEVTWHSSEIALRTVDGLLSQEAVHQLGMGVVSDLRALREALVRAAERGVRFGLVLREGRDASAPEMDRRAGSFF